MIENIIQKDKELLIYLNNLGSEQWDGLWLVITNQFYWIPFFIFILFLVFKHLGWKKGLFTMLFIAALITFSDQITNVIRGVFERLRPNNDPAIKDSLRTLIRPQSFSFTSGHATTSTVITVFLIMLLRKHVKAIKFLIFFPLVFAYSRLYLGVHFPIDILCGFINGTVIGCLAYKLYEIISRKIFD
ncbi:MULTISPECIES: phosphatase PAP2 family protein [Tenacibaculum]|uniref:phosphatase PAP2 family protein n=1 Tax=Tenacibaculum TaxID=104267 RepID=UPI0021AF5293|nr:MULTISPECIES: phosphatase PAP2 family protein [Tenacibaculum]MCT4697958.1 phosphatase PAP2 family protein [Tenacibaculum haliotis]WBX71974.1 phosphatase PAP2 family protein [Tenacibaculum retecalamus]